jgi:thiol-disulfide isomerase/thioredoxin
VVDVGELRQEMQKAHGQSLFVHLWATWCGPCLEELPLVDQFARAARARGAVVLSVSLDNDPRGIARVQGVLRGRAPSLTALVARFEDPGQFMTLFSSSWEGAIPALFAFDGAGKLKSSLIGEVDPKEFETLLHRIAPR